MTADSVELKFKNGSSNGIGNDGYCPDDPGNERGNGSIDGIKNSDMLQKTMGYRQGFALLLGLIMGSGIFISPHLVAAQTMSPGVMIVVWVAAGSLALMGSLCYCELGGIFKVAGGNYLNILKVYGRIPAFLCAWTTCIVIDPSCIATIALTIGLYLAKPFYSSDEEAEGMGKFIAFLFICIALVLNCMSSRVINKIQSCMAVTQVGAVLFVICVGIYEMSQNKLDNIKGMFNGTVMSSHAVTHVGIAVFGALWSYDGWSAMNNMVEEMKNVERDLLLTIMTAFPFVIVAYVLINLSLLTILTHAQIASSKAVAVDFITLALGKKTSYFMMVLVGMSAYGTLNGSLFACSRLTLAAAREGHMPRFLSFINKRTKSPVPGIVLAAGVASLMLIPKASDLNALLLLFSQAQWIIYGSSIAGVVILRIRQPDLQRPFKVFIGIPILMTLVALTLVIIPFFQSTLFSILLFGFILVGLPVYMIFIHYHHKLPTGFLRIMEFISDRLEKHFGMVPCQVNDL